LPMGAFFRKNIKEIGHNFGKAKIGHNLAMLNRTVRSTRA